MVNIYNDNILRTLRAQKLQAWQSNDSITIEKLDSLVKEREKYLLKEKRCEN